MGLKHLKIFNRCSLFSVTATMLLWLVLTFAVTASAHAQAGSLTTIFASNNGQAGNMFDVITFGQDIRVESLDVNINGTGTIEVYTRPGTWVGNQNNAAGWTLRATVPGVTGAPNTPTNVDIPDFVLDAGTTTAFYVTSTTANIRYTNGTRVGAVAAANSVLRINQGAGKSYPFGATFQPRIWNGTINYTALTYDMAVNKTVSPATVSTLPQTLSYTISLNNTATGSITGISLADVLTQGGTATNPSLTGPAGDANSNGELDAGETWTYTASYPLTQANFDDGNDIVNSVTVSSNEVADRSDDATTTLTLNPSLTITKTADTTTDVAAGQTVTYTYEITNNGNVTIDNVSVTDAHSGSGTPPTPTAETLFSDAFPLNESTDAVSNNGIWSTLSPGDTVRFSASYVVQQRDVDLLQ